MKYFFMRIGNLTSLLLLLLLLFCFPALAQESDQANEVSTYSGTIGKIPVRMILRINGNKISGVYFYEKYLKDIVIKGTIENKRSFQIDEYDQAGKIAAKFVGNFPAKDPKGELTGELGKDLMIGNWSKADGTNVLPFNLSLSGSVSAPELGHGFYDVAGVKDDLQMEEKARKFKEAVLNGDKEQVAGFIHYPVLVQIKGKPTKIKTRAELIHLYEQIFTNEYVETIRGAVPHYMFARDQGVMFDGGSVWFNSDYQVITLNN